MWRIMLLFLLILLAGTGFSQYNWKLEKDKNGIKVYKSDIPGSDFKAIKVECTLAGNYTKLISVLTNVARFSDWIYNTKSTNLVQQITPLDIIYYSETYLPWPMANRDAVIRIKIKTDSLPRLLTITGSSESARVAIIPGKVRVSHYVSKWRVIMPSANTIRIHYILEVDPGGSIPGWVANMFAEKGPYETFSNLASQLKQ